MALRKWLVRGLVFVIAGGLTVSAFAYLRWTDPAVVRQQVVGQLAAHLPGAFVTLDAARLRLLGGIGIHELRLTRRDDSDRTDVLCVPGGVIYHDKEQLSYGRLAIRKIELHRPRIRVVRDPDGRWNVKGLLGPVDLTKAIPTIVLQQGTIFFEDRTRPALPILEIKDVHLTILNDPLPTLAFQGTGLTDLAGPVKLRGTWQRATEELAATFDVPTIPVGPTLVQCLAAYLPKRLAEDARQLEGVGQLEARFHYRPESQQWDHDLRGKLTRGRLRHALIPLPLEELEAAARVANGRITLENCTARAGETRLRATGERASFREGAEMSGELTVENLSVNAELFERLPPQLAALRRVNEDFAPTGPLDLTWKFQAKDGELAQEGTLTLKGLRLRFREFPYPLVAVTGTLDANVAPEGHLAMLRMDLTGMAGGQPVRVTGTVAGPKPAAVEMKLWGKDIPLDETLLAALPSRGGIQDLARSFHAQGKTDFEAYVHREQGNERFSNRYVARIHDTTARYDIFPYPLERISAILTILPDHWEVRDFFGTHKGAEIRGHGQSHPTDQSGSRKTIELRGKNLLLDAELRTALEKSVVRAAGPAWDKFRPAGRLDFRALIELPPSKQPAEYDVTLVARNCTVLPEFLPYTLTDLNGTLHCTRGRVEPRNVTRVELRNITARHGDSVVRLDKGEVVLKEGGGFFALLPDVEANPLIPDADLLRALPASLREGLTSLRLRDPVRVAGELRVDMPAEAGQPPLIYWDGGVLLQNAAVRLGVPFQQVSGRVYCRGRHQGKLEGVLGHVQLDQATLFDQPFRDVHCRLVVAQDSPDVLSIPQLTAGFFGGTVGGQGRVEFGPTFRFELDLTALQVKLEQIGRHNLRDKADLSGEAVARLYLKGEGTELSGLEGGGSLDIPSGKLYNLPLLLDLLKFLSVRWPDRTAFEEAHARFTIHGPRVQINRLELLGNAISLGGEGRMNLDGTDMDLDLYTVWGRIVQMLPPSVKDLPPWVSRQFLKIKVRGPIQKPQFDKEPVPVLMEPMKELLQRMTGGR